jgi:hypothetical protein
MIIGHLEIEKFLHSVSGLVTGSVVTDAKDRQYRQSYSFTDGGSELLQVKRADGHGDIVLVPKRVPMDESLVAFFGLYSGDGAKGTEHPNEPGRIVPSISFSQKEKHLVRFAVDQFRRLFPGAIRFTFSLGEDSALFMAGEWLHRLDQYYASTTGNPLPPPLDLEQIRNSLTKADEDYLKEHRPDIEASNEANLAFYYQHKSAMEEILTAEKEQELASVGINRGSDIRVTASLRRPFKKGARQPGGSSRSDEIHLGGLNGLGELFLKMMHEIEDSVLKNTKISSSGLVQWIDTPSQIGNQIDLYDFFTRNLFGKINNARPSSLEVQGERLIGRWKQGSIVAISKTLKIDPLWCYISGLYLAEGSTPKETLFQMFSKPPGSMALGFTSSEGTSLELMLRSLRKLFPPESCLETWKVKVGSQYFPELVMTGLKNGVPMLRGGNSGDGKLRTMEISLAIKEWALAIADEPLGGEESLLRKEYSDRYSHVEPTGSGVARIDFATSSSLCRWYFPLLMHTVFSEIVSDPSREFYE